MTQNLVICRFSEQKYMIITCVLFWDTRYIISHLWRLCLRFGGVAYTVTLNWQNNGVIYTLSV